MKISFSRNCRFFSVLSLLLVFPFLHSAGDIPELTVKAVDFDHDGVDDIAVYRPTTGEWFIRGSANGLFDLQWGGGEGDIPVPADYDGDGKVDLAVYRPDSGRWLIRPNRSEILGDIPEDVPIVGDYDGDGKADLAIFRPGSARPEGHQEFNLFRYIRSSDSKVVSVDFGFAGAVPLRGDFDGDGTDDLAYFYPSEGNGVPNTVAYRGSTAGQKSVHIGISGDIPVPHDYDGDGATDVAVVRKTGNTSTWVIIESSDLTFRKLIWGLSSDLPVPGDYDGDGAADIAGYRAGLWNILQSSGGSSETGFGRMSTAPVFYGGRKDLPVPTDLDGDGKSDVTVYRPSTGAVYTNLSSGGNASLDTGLEADRAFAWNEELLGGSTVITYSYSRGTWRFLNTVNKPVSFRWGGPGFEPVPADYDGDGLSDAAVYRPSTGSWHFRFSSGSTSILPIFGGFSADIPLAADFDNDGKADPVIYRLGRWFIYYSTTQVAETFLFGGGNNFIPMVEDMDMDGFAEVLVYNKVTGKWNARTNVRPGQTPQPYGSTVVLGGLPGDIPAPADYDGDGVVDYAVVRDGAFQGWWILESSTGNLRAGRDLIRYGTVNDLPAGQVFVEVETAPKLDELIGAPGPGGGFIWKPVSEGDGKLVVLLPASLTDSIRAGWIADEEGEVVEVGRFTTDSHNGGREHYRFSLPGRGYGNNLYFVSKDRQGNLIHWPIPSGANRYDY